MDAPIVKDEEVRLETLEDVKSYIRENVVYRMEAGLVSYAGAEFNGLVGVEVIDDLLEVGLNTTLSTGYYNSTFRFGPYIQASLRQENGSFYVRVSRDYANDFKAIYNQSTGEFDQYETHNFENTYVLGREIRNNKETVNYNIKVRDFLNDEGENMKIYTLGFGLKF